VQKPEKETRSRPRGWVSFDCLWRWCVRGPAFAAIGVHGHEAHANSITSLLGGRLLLGQVMMVSAVCAWK
jgi:hypothetical protein